MPEETIVIEYDHILTKGLQSSLNNTPIQDGKLRYTTDTGNLYLDIVEKVNDQDVGRRLKITDVIDTYTESYILNNILAPMPKIYLASDTHKMYVSNGLEWVEIGPTFAKLTENLNKEQPLWFSDTSVNSQDYNPKYDNNLSYNASTQQLKSPKVNTTELTVDNMIITTVTDSETGQRTVTFSFTEPTVLENQATDPSEQTDEESLEDLSNEEEPEEDPNQQNWEEFGN